MADGKTFRSILIDPYAKTVTEVFLDPKKLLKEWYAHCRCDCIEVPVRHINGRRIDLVIDESGRIKEPPQTAFAIKVDETTPEAEELCGPALIIGAPDNEGESTPAPKWVTVEAIKEKVLWADRSHAAFPDHWILKVLFIGPKDALKIAATYANPYIMDKLQSEHQGESREELSKHFEAAGALGMIHLDPVDYGMSNDHDKLKKLFEDAGEDIVIRAIINGVMEKIRLHVAETVLKIEPDNLFLIRQ